MRRALVLALLGWVFTVQFSDANGYTMTWTSKAYTYYEETTVEVGGQPMKVPGCKEARIGFEGLMRQLYEGTQHIVDGGDGYGITACVEVK